MYKIITKSAHNALLYQIEDLKKKLESANENIESYKEDLNELELKNHIKQEQVDAWYMRVDKLQKTHIDLQKKYDLCASRHKSCALRNEKLQKVNTSLLSKNESLTAENHRLGNLLQVKCDEVKTLEKKVDSKGLLTKDFNQLNTIERHVVEAVNTLLNIPRRSKTVNSAITILKDALKIRQ